MIPVMAPSVWWFPILILMRSHKLMPSVVHFNLSLAWFQHLGFKWNQLMHNTLNILELTGAYLIITLWICSPFQCHLLTASLFFLEELYWNFIEDFFIFVLRFFLSIVPSFLMEQGTETALTRVICSRFSTYSFTYAYWFCSYFPNPLTTQACFKDLSGINSLLLWRLLLYLFPIWSVQYLQKNGFSSFQRQFVMQ